MHMTVAASSYTHRRFAFAPPRELVRRESSHLDPSSISPISARFMSFRYSISIRMACQLCFRAPSRSDQQTAGGTPIRYFRNRSTR